MSDIDTVVVDSLKALDPKWPIREADIARCNWHVAEVPIAAVPNVHSRKAPATWANPQVLLLKKWTVTGF